MTPSRTPFSTPPTATHRYPARRNRVLTLLAVLAVALAPLLGAAPGAAASTTDVCALYCDTLDPSQAQSETFPAPDVDLNGDVIELHVDDVLGMAWGSIDTGQLNDSIWLDRSWDGGGTWDGLLGQAWIPSGWTGTRTLMYNMYDPDDHARAVIRACGDAGGQVACTDWVHLSVCSAQCDGISSSATDSASPVPDTTLDGRDVGLRIDNSTGMAYATIADGAPGDSVWLDRSWNEGASDPDGSELGLATTPSGDTGTSTDEFNIDDTLGRLYGGTVRACGYVNGVTDCTEWSGSDSSQAAAAADALMYSYDPYDAWWPSSWWNSAVALTSIIDYTRETGDTTYEWIINRTFEVDQAAFAAGVRATNAISGDFISSSTDDDEWWALAWVDAYNLTGDQAYLNMAVTIADYVETMWDGTCGGGLWSDTTKSYKNAITNALYVRLTAELHVAVSGDTTWLTQADNAWSWFQNSGMINGSGLVNDGLNSSTSPCTNNGGTVWSYNQGMTIGAAVEMYRATGDSADLSTAEYLANSAINSPLLVTDGVLTESCDALNATCDDDQKQFKGIFMDYLGDLNSVVGGTYTSFIDTQINTLWTSDRNSLNQFGERWDGQTSTADPNIVSWRTQASALEAILAGQS